MVFRKIVCLFFLIGISVELSSAAAAGPAQSVAQRGVRGAHVRAKSATLPLEHMSKLSKFLADGESAATEDVFDAIRQLVQVCEEQQKMSVVSQSQVSLSLNLLQIQIGQYQCLLKENSGWRALDDYVQKLAITNNGIENTSAFILSLINDEYCQNNFGSEGPTIALAAQFVHKICTFYNANLSILKRAQGTEQDASKARQELQTATNQIKNQPRQLTEQDKQLKEFKELQETFERHKALLLSTLGRSTEIYESLHNKVMRLDPNFAFQGDPSPEEQINLMLGFLDNALARLPQSRSTSSNQAGLASSTLPAETALPQPRASTGIGAAALSAGVFSVWGNRIGSTIAERLQSESAPQFLQNVEKEYLEHACGSVAMVAVAGAAGALAMKAEESFLAIENRETKRKIRNTTRLMGLACGAGVVLPKLWAVTQHQPITWGKHDTTLAVASGTLLAASQRMDSAMLQTF
jgi:hypothetical protein